MNAHKIVVDLKSNKIDKVELTADNLQQIEVDKINHEQKVKKNNDLKQIPTLELRFKMLWEAIVSNDLTKVRALEAIIEVMRAKYPEEDL